VRRVIAVQQMTKVQ